MKIEIKTLSESDDKSLMEQCVEIIHKVAELNGSSDKCILDIENGNDIKCKRSYANCDYTIGYRAVLFLIDFGRKNRLLKSCYTDTGKWFSIQNVDPKELIDYLTKNWP